MEADAEVGRDIYLLEPIDAIIRTPFVLMGLYDDDSRISLFRNVTVIGIMLAFVKIVYVCVSCVQLCLDSSILIFNEKESRKRSNDWIIILLLLLATIGLSILNIPAGTTILHQLRLPIFFYFCKIDFWFSHLFQALEVNLNIPMNRRRGPENRDIPDDLFYHVVLSSISVIVRFAFWVKYIIGGDYYYAVCVSGISLILHLALDVRIFGVRRVFRKSPGFYRYGNVFLAIMCFMAYCLTYNTALVLENQLALTLMLAFQYSTFLTRSDGYMTLTYKRNMLMTVKVLNKEYSECQIIIDETDDIKERTRADRYYPLTDEEKKISIIRMHMLEAKRRHQL